jgi:hypothetical protein
MGTDYDKLAENVRDCWAAFLDAVDEAEKVGLFPHVVIHCNSVVKDGVIPLEEAIIKMKKEF